MPISTEDWMNWYHNLSADEKKKYNQKRYQRAKSDPKFKEKIIERYQKDQDYYKCYGIHYRVKQIPWCLTSRSPKPKELTSWFKENSGKPCKYCGNPSYSIDHIIPVSKNGKHEFENLQIICYKCNIAKSDQSEEEFIFWLRQVQGNLSSKVVV